ncbi:Zn(2)-C6 fungal-type domain-containing protein [Fusarium keratoplasticum]|uniref:Zn(2)-C6 fungal-type domain-containing protein n=1 Tax=Fusarium keratoplasticum TaxID=1328300 RepID=A0ACC0R3A8_9HYPO|nr:Zn(2)-C6 fungal-type domain-containing protein [Fusarium keratoplasticum]KAI8674800.1 Zn(2)-C6 fungal-type domain-containing protein [Fusarium keratoplasticum]KAI8681265.1 Zn(2)-C6 fungal-type domain-containing protein [Fusarium keratoplasticum]
MRPMPIIRSRTGCFTCRRRKKKCDEKKPVCSGCKRNKLECHWPEPTNNNNNNSSSSSSQPRTSKASASVAPDSASAGIHRPVQVTTERRSFSQPLQHRRHQTELESDHEPEPERDPEDQPTIVVSASSHPGLLQNGPGPPDDTSPTSDDAHMIDAEADDEAEDQGQPSPSASTTTSSASSSDSPTTILPASRYDRDVTNALALAVASAGPSDAGFTMNGGIPMPMSMLPQQGHHSYELLSYYLARTANSMGNGSTDVNPFISKLIPLAFSKPLVLQLILAQSAAHRQASAEPLPTDEVAQRYYTDSLRMFRNVVDEYVSGNAENTLVLTVGSLIMCLTEVAKGDIHGTIFDHLTASKSLVSTLLTGGQTEPYGDLPDFLIEYYMHMAATSMISIDPQYNSQSLLSPDIEFRARELVTRKYVGQLCGCWLELLILISQIFHLGQSMLAVVDGQTVPPSPDSIVNFSFLQSQVMGFFPDPSVSPYSRLAGLVWKQAVLLYLWSVLGTPQPQANTSVHKALMDSAVAEAITLLDQFPASERINTSLCWPLAVIGCCTSDPIVQQVLRDRLQTMLDTIGLGNMRQTLVLLEHIWREPLEQVSPWTLCRAMREHQIWISFA